MNPIENIPSNNLSDDLAKRIILQSEIVDLIEKANFQGSVNVPMRVGKSHIGVKAIAKLFNKLTTDPKDFKVLWVTSETKLRDVDIPNTFKIEGKEDLLDYVTIIHYKSLGKHKGKYNLIILDEYQHVTLSNQKTFDSKELQGDSILGFTGTPPEQFSKKSMTRKLFSNTIYSMTIDQGVDEGIISDYRVTVIDFELNSQELTYTNSRKEPISELQKYDNLTYAIEQCKVDNRDYSFLTKLRMHVVYGSINRKRILKQLSTHRLFRSKRGLIFVPYKKLASYMGKHHHSTSGSKDYKSFQNHEINQLTLVRKGGTGHTYEDIEYIIIGQATNDFIGSTTQSYGRGLMYKEGAPLEIYFLRCINTVDKNWVDKALSKLDKDKITYINIKDFK